MSSADWQQLTADNRNLAADTFAALTDAQWEAPTLCSEWTVRDIAAHLTMPFEVSLPRFAFAVMRERGHVDRASVRESRRLAQQPADQIVASLRAHARHRFTPPVVGPGGQLADTAIHLRDAARPLGLEASPPVTTWTEVLTFLTSRRARIGFVPRGRLNGLALSASDSDWRFGEGQQVRGPSEALALALAGRPAAFRDLDGDGAVTLQARLR